jgi:hypothetical protein
LVNIRGYDSRWAYPARKLILPISSKDEIISVYLNIRGNLLNDLKLQSSFSLNLFRRGYTEDFSDPTILITCSDPSQIQITCEVPDTLRLEIQQRNISTFKGLGDFGDFDKFSDKISNGHIIGVKGKNSKATFGGYLIDNNNQIYGTTAGHFVDGYPDMKLVQPTESLWEKEKEEDTKEKDDESISKHNQRNETLVFGEQFIYEHKIDNGERQDWSLIKILNRLGQNRDFKLRKGYGRIKGIRSPQENTKVSKYGGASELTHGTINGVQSDVKLNGDISSTKEWAIVASVKTSDQHFGLKGDSGSWIVDYNGYLVGTLLGGDETDGTVTFMSSMEKIISRINTLRKLKLSVYEPNMV